MKRFLTRKQSAEFLTEQGLTVTNTTLQKLASVGGGPEYRIFGNRAVYAPDELLAWAYRVSQINKRGRVNGQPRPS